MTIIADTQERTRGDIKAEVTSLKRQRIMEAATKLFAAQGFHGTSVDAIAAARAQSAGEARQLAVAEAERLARDSGREWEVATGRAGRLADQLAERFRLDPERTQALRSALREAVLALVTWDLASGQSRDLFLPVAEFFPIAQSERAG